MLNEKRLAFPFVFLTTVGFAAGATFNHYISFPYMIAFFGTFHTAELSFTDVRVPKANLLGEEGRGFVYLMENLPQERVSIRAE